MSLISPNSNYPCTCLEGRRGIIGQKEGSSINMHSSGGIRVIEATIELKSWKGATTWGRPIRACEEASSPFVYLSILSMISVCFRGFCMLLASMITSSYNPPGIEKVASLEELYSTYDSALIKFHTLCYTRREVRQAGHSHGILKR